MKNKKYTALIVEDEMPAQQLIMNFLADDPEIELIKACDDGFEGLKAINEHKPDILFLDIQVPKLTGFEILELIECNPVIIFSTAYDEYAIKAFSSNAADYLLKPYSRKRFHEALQRAKSKIASSQSVKPSTPELSPEEIERIVVKTKSKLEIIKRAEIFYLQSDDDYVRIYSKKGDFMKNDTMKKYDGKLGRDFVRIHRSTLVNVNFIDNIHLMEKESYEVILHNGTRLKVSKSGYKLLKEVLGM
jgi:two-component system LytT family response regulator